ncbi:hypothetical protein HDU99_007000 [Rhizoclosmatium hyalinum]|nr:hypothetical protein HDU99_007000 [Rhizoclosmatium hyalinum]
MHLFWLVVVGISAHGASVRYSNQRFESRISAMGPALKTSVSGVAVPVGDGCSAWPSSASDQPQLDNVAGPWVAVARRGNCAFADKVFAMQQLGAAAVVVGDGDGGASQLLTMVAPEFDPPQIEIPSVFVSYASYRRIVDDVVSAEKDAPLVIELTPSDWLTKLYLILVFLFAPLMASLAYYLVHVLQMIQRHFNNMQAKRIVYTLPTRLFKGSIDSESNSSVGSDETACCICLEEYRTGDLLRILPCHHEFHPGCVDL